jgi:hypothetical protein
MDGSVGFDAVIVCTSNIAQEKWVASHQILYLPT